MHWGSHFSFNTFAALWKVIRLHWALRSQKGGRRRENVSIQWKIIKYINKRGNCYSSNEEEKQKKNNFRRIINAHSPQKLKQLIFKIAIPVGGNSYSLFPTVAKKLRLQIVLKLCRFFFLQKKLFIAIHCGALVFFMPVSLKALRHWHLRSLAMRF